ncbi:hypothetical protein Q9233_009579 [Columba guinea]|nr:hypothetical protein Q9233_009579 [Columba guinea]
MSARRDLLTWNASEFRSIEPCTEDVACICLPIFTGRFCERILNPCELLPCLNNATCVAQQLNYNCR